MVADTCPLQELDDLALGLKVQELRTVRQDDHVLTRCFEILIDRGLNKKGATSIEIYQFVGDVFCTPGLPIEVLHYTCRNLLQRTDSQLICYHAIQRVMKDNTSQLLFNLDALLSMVSSQLPHPAPPPVLQMIQRIHAGDHHSDASVHAETTNNMSDEEIQDTFLFHTYADPGLSCRHCLRQTYFFWRHVYPQLRPEWMRQLHIRPEGLFSITKYKKWFEEDQRAYFRSLDVDFNETDPWSLEMTTDTPFYFLQRTTKCTAKKHHVFQLFALQAHLAAAKGEAKNPFDRSLLGAKNKTECKWSIATIRRAARQMNARSSACTSSSLTSCRKE